MAAVIERWALGSIATLMGAELNALASSGTLVAGAIGTTPYNNAAGGGGGDAFTRCLVELFVNGFATAPNPGTSAFVWFLLAVDDVGREDGGAAAIPLRQPDVVIPFRPAAGSQRIARGRIWLPPGTFVGLLSHNAGVAFGATGNLLRIRPYTAGAG